jgi:FkbM family methyltransferase
VPGGQLSEEDNYLRSLDLRGKVVYDVGGFFGYKTLFFASRAAHVVVYEPNPMNRAKLERNIAINALRNVTVRNVGLGSKSDVVTATWDANLPGESSAVSGRGKNSFEFEVVTLDAEIRSLALTPDFVKIDVEGFEVEVLRGATSMLSTYHPEVMVEMHGQSDADNLALCADALVCLRSAGYDEIIDLERGRELTSPTEPVSHIAARMRGRSDQKVPGNAPPSNSRF